MYSIIKLSYRHIVILTVLQLASNITIGPYQFYNVHKVKSKSTWKNFTDTCNLFFPRNLKTKDNLKIDQVIQMGMPVNVQLGYVPYTVANQPQGGGLVQRFNGFVSQAPGAATAVVEIICEDWMWKLKQNSLTKGWQNATLADIVSYIKQQTNSTWSYEILGDKIELGAFKVEKASAAKILFSLKEKYGLYAWFKPGQPANAQVLQIGKPYEPNPANWNQVNFAYGRNVTTWKDLQYKRANECLLKATVRNHLPNGQVHEITVGDVGGEERCLDFFNISDNSTLNSLANELLAKMKYDGYRGHFPTKGEPVVFHGYVANMSSYRYPERNGSLFIDEVEIDYEVNGEDVAHFNQIITLGPSATVQDT